MELIIASIVTMWVMNVIVIWVVFMYFTRINNIILNKLLQIEIVKKAKTFEEAKDFWIKDITAEQNFEKKIVDEQKKAFDENTKMKTKEELEKAKEEAEWQNL